MASMSLPRGAMAQAGPQAGAAAALAWTVMLACLVLQRLAIPVGELKVSLAVPVVGAAALAGLAAGVLVLDRLRVVLLLVLAAIGCLSMALAVHLPLVFAPRQSVASLAQFLLLTGFAVLAVARPVPARAAMGAVADAVALVALAGIAQFLLQFVGFGLFSFQGLVPDAFLNEEAWAVVLPIEGTMLNRSNGFFLVEPSVLSQVVAIALMIETLWFRRPARFALLGAAFVVGGSGTVLLVLGCFGLTLAAMNRGRGLLLAAGLAIGAALAAGAAALLLPDVFAAFAGRADEVAREGSSGHERFVTPFLIMAEAFGATPRTLLLGLGPGSAEHLAVPWRYWTNTPAKVLIDYGVPGFACYLGLLVAGPFDRPRLLMLPALLVLLLLTGGYHQFAPMLFIVLLLTTLLRLAPEDDPA